MITKEFLEKIDIINSNLLNYYLDMKQTDLEIVLSRLSKLTEEVGELNSDILKKFYKRKIDKFSEDNLKGEFADVIICLSLLAKSLNIDLNEAIKGKLEIIKERGGI